MSAMSSVFGLRAFWTDAPEGGASGESCWTTSVAFVPAHAFGCMCEGVWHVCAWQCSKNEGNHTAHAMTVWTHRCGVVFCFDKAPGPFGKVNMVQTDCSREVCEEQKGVGRCNLCTGRGRSLSPDCIAFHTRHSKNGCMSACHWHACLWGSWCAIFS